MKKSVFNKLFSALLSLGVLLSGSCLFAQSREVPLVVDGIEKANENSDRDIYLLTFRGKSVASISCYDLGYNTHILRIGRRTFNFKKGPFCKRAVNKIKENSEENKETVIVALHGVDFLGGESAHVKSIN